MRPPASSKHHRNSQRISAALEVITNSSMFFSPAAAIPPKVSQVVVNAYSFFKCTNKSYECAVSGAQALIAAGNVAALTALVVDENNCTDRGATFCQVALMCQLVYEGVLLATWAISEKEKEHGPGRPGSAESTQSPRP